MTVRILHDCWNWKVARKWCVIAVGAGWFAGCATTTTTDSPAASRTDAYSTQFLGPDGRVISRPSSLAAAKRAEEQSWWAGDGVNGSPSIEINLSSQKAKFFKGGKLVGEAPVSTGREGYRTPAGNFRVTQKNKNHRSNLYGDYVDKAGNIMVANVGVHEDRKPAGAKFQGAEMPYFMRIHGGVGLHAGFLPGFADSHGCIRLPEKMAAIYFAHAEHGTPVRVTY
ncbi:MAG: L,D-transpeptidase family protein [Chthoniobacterales bacterium]